MALSALSISTSGLQAAHISLQASAHNIANINTEGYKRQFVNKNEILSGGVRTRIHRNDTPGDTQLNPLTGEITEGSNVNLITEMTNLIQSLAFAQSNASVIRSQVEMLGLIVNITV